MKVIIEIYKEKSDEEFPKLVQLLFPMIEHLPARGGIYCKDFGDFGRTATIVFLSHPKGDFPYTYTKPDGRFTYNGDRGMYTWEKDKAALPKGIEESPGFKKLKKQIRETLEGAA
jgi:hypothetical protein